MTTALVAVVTVALATSVFGGARNEATAASSTGRVVTPNGMREPLYPLRVGPTKRYLVDRRGQPFLIVGDSPQALIVNASLTDAEEYFADRAARGFNSVWINLLCKPYTGGRPDGTTFDGIAPFTRPGDLAAPDERYFRRADAMIRLAARHGLTVFLDPIETGDWLKVLRRNGVAKDFAYGKWLGTRYRTFPNIVWFNGNDFQQWRDPRADAVALAVARGIRTTDKRHIHTVELNYQTSGSRDDPRWTPFIELDAAYTYNPTYAQVLKEYNRVDVLPTVMVEANYEFEHEYTGSETLRRQEYWSLLSGAAGQLYGSRYTWPFIGARLFANKYMWTSTPGWRNRLDTAGVAELEYVTKLFSGRPWFKLVPDQRHELVTAGFGTFATSGSVNDNDFATAARTPDGKLAVAYLPTRRRVTVALGRLKGNVEAQWYDPTTGKYLVISGSPFASKGTRQFSPPGANAAGDDDWVLVLTAL